MTWARIDDGFLTHPKAMAAGIEGRALFIAGLLYSSRELTDGLISPGAAEALAGLAGIRRLQPVAAVLVRVGLWETVEGGYQVHDYDKYNPTRAEVEAKRGAARDAGRRGGLAKGLANRLADGLADGLAPGLAESKHSHARGRPVPRTPTVAKATSSAGDDDVAFDDGGDPAFGERFSAMVTAYGGRVNQRMADEYTQIAEEYSLDEITAAIRAVRRNPEKRLFPSEIRRALPRTEEAEEEEGSFGGYVELPSVDQLFKHGNKTTAEIKAEWIEQHPGEHPPWADRVTVT